MHDDNCTCFLVRFGKVFMLLGMFNRQSKKIIVLLNFYAYYRYTKPRRVMYKVDLPVDNSADVAVERRRAAEAARQARIFNTRHRVMGLDLKALEQQVVENKEREEMAGQRERAFGKHKARGQVESILP